MSRRTDLLVSPALPAAAATARDAAPDAARPVLAQSGAALDASQRQHYEGALAGVGREHAPDAAEVEARQSAQHSEGASTPDAARADFSRVRVHSDAMAAESAARLGARAYTWGEHIVFGAQQFAPDSAPGRALLAHELTHVAQQQAMQQPYLARDSLSEYKTESTDVTRGGIEKFSAAGNYWEQKVQTQFAVIYRQDVQKRLKANAEEMSAVMSVAWNVKPAGAVTSAEEKVVSIAARPSAAKSKALLFKFTFDPAADAKSLPSLTVELLGEGEDAKVGAAPTPPAGYNLPKLPRSAAGFPGGIDAYFASFPDEQKQLYLWIENAPGPAFNQVVTTQSTVNSKRHDSAIRAKGSKNEQGKVTSLEMTWLAETPMPVSNPPPGYGDMDMVDLEIEKLQNPSDAKAAKLGEIKGLAGLPADERVSVKYAAQQYFANGTRSAEVDIRLPIANSTKQVLYTLRFRSPSNDVDVERVGEEGKDAKANLDAVDIARTNGYAQNAKDAATLKTWLAKRYPAISVTAADVPKITEEANKALTTGAGTPAWFASTYGMKVLDQAAAATRLQTAHKLDVSQTTGTKDFSATELLRMEFALQNFSDPLLAMLRGVNLLRQDAELKLSGKGASAKVTTGDSAGLTWRDGSEITVGIFDRASKADNLLFVGGSRGTRAAGTLIDVHEFGHVVGDQKGIATAYAAFIAKKKIKPLTWYAKSDPGTESFPEAFAIFHQDPEWMSSNLPELFTWFETLSSTGKPPP